jgi:hypothetical protein
MYLIPQAVAHQTAPLLRQIEQLTNRLHNVEDRHLRGFQVWVKPLWGKTIALTVMTSTTTDSLFVSIHNLMPNNIFSIPSDLRLIHNGVQLEVFIYYRSYIVVVCITACDNY